MATKSYDNKTLQKEKKNQKGKEMGDVDDGDATCYRHRQNRRNIFAAKRKKSRRHKLQPNNEQKTGQKMNFYQTAAARRGYKF